MSDDDESNWVGMVTLEEHYRRLVDHMWAYLDTFTSGPLQILTNPILRTHESLDRAVMQFVDAYNSLRSSHYDQVDEIARLRALVLEACDAYDHMRTMPGNIRVDSVGSNIIHAEWTGPPPEDFLRYGDRIKAIRAEATPAASTATKSPGR